MSYLINTIKHLSGAHRHINYEIIVHIHGTGTLHTDERDFPVSPGKIAIIPPGTIHNGVSDDGELERIYINGEFNQVFNLTSPVIISDNPEREGTLLAKLIFNNRYENPDYVASLCNALAHFLVQNLKMDDSIGMAVKEIIYEITENFHDCNIDLAYILQKSGYAEDYIRAQFKKLTGKTPIEFLTEVRIRHARYLIDVYRNSLPLSLIAEKCGYTDYIYFSRRFRQVMEMSPKKYKDLC